jgi:hypothetical protein
MKTSPAVRCGLGLLAWTTVWLLLWAGAGNDLAIGALLLVTMALCGGLVAWLVAQQRRRLLAEAD